MIAMSLRHNMQSHLILLLGLVHSLNGDAHQQSPLETMADVTNDFGVCVLQIISAPNTNTVFSPYGLVSMALLVYEGATGQAAAEIYNTLHLPWHRDIVRIGFRDLHRYLRSYFSSEGFLKGLVLSKSNVHLRPKYVEVLKFYGFQPDTAITQAVLTTQMVSIGNETTTNIPTTTVPTTNVPTTIVPKTTVPTNLTTMKEGVTSPPDTTTTFDVQNKTETTIPEKGVDTTLPPINTTVETRTEILTATNKLPTQPEVLAMLGPGSEQTTINPPTTQKTTITTFKPGETTMLTTIIGETTKKDIVPTEPILPVTTIPTQKPTTIVETTTEQVTTLITDTTPKVFVTTTIPPTKAIVNQEMHTDVVTTEMNVVTLNNEDRPQLESMNMVLHKPNKTEEKETTTQTTLQTDIGETTTKTTSQTDIGETTTQTTPQTGIGETTTQTTTKTTPQTEIGETTTEYIKTIFSQLVPIDNKEKKKEKEVFTEKTETIPFSTMLLDTTIPLEELVLLTTPPDAEVVQDKSASMLEAIIILEDKKPIPYPDISTDNTIKRSTKYDSAILNRPVTNHFEPYPTTPYSYFFSSLNGRNQTQTTYIFTPHDTQSGNSAEDNEHSATSSQEYNYASEESLNSIENTSETLYDGHTQSMDEINTVDEMPGSSFEEEKEQSGFPTLEPDTIIFPTISHPRLHRSVKSDERPPPQLGNWVGVAATWRSNPTDQWFWTYSGDKLVPVLTYTAFLPYAEIPDLQATILQLPLDDSRYSLMVLLPKNSQGLKQMLHTLQWHSLRTILKSLKPTAVYAVVPAFTIVKHINLTPALHKLGIRNVFDAYVANLAEMSDEPNLYVRSVEQAITISVRKYFAYHKWFEASPSQVEKNFLATHPFAYFVMDEETKVALIAGTIVDPLQHTA